MSVVYPLALHRRVERQWAERVNLLRQTRVQIVVETKTALHRVFNNDGSAYPSRDKSGRGSAATQSQPHD
jgi:hypothetical protein